MKILKTFFVLVIFIIVGTLGFIYVYVKLNEDTIITQHCNMEVRRLQMIKKKIYSEFTGDELAKKLQEWGDRLDLTVEECKENFFAETNYTDISFIGKAKLLFITKNLDN